MLGKDARHFVFLSRSGISNASSFFEELDDFAYKHDVKGLYQVIAGSVSSRLDVDKAVAAAKRLGPVKGVIQAAAVFEDILFEELTTENVNAVFNPKIQGTINLHEALLDQSLDFFVMTSSALGFKGPATQTLYAAANTFQDSMARYRWSLGMQATSLSLGMVQGKLISILKCYRL
jgi:NADP-dependent 3-hydroxy acid dehydrogenase YdfG